MKTYRRRMNQHSVQLARRRKSQARRSASRGLIAERLEDRRLLSGVETPYHNSLAPTDVSRDWVVSPRDALLVINALNSGGSQVLDPNTKLASDSPRLDTNGDNILSPIDALRVVNALNRGEGLDNAVAFRLELQDSSGTPIQPLRDGGGHLILDAENDPIYPVNVGQVFRVQVYNDDLRTTGSIFGVYEGTLDIAYSDPALFSMGGTKPDDIPNQTTFESFFIASSLYFGNDKGSFNVYQSKPAVNIDGDSVPNEFDELQALAKSTEGHGSAEVPFVYVTLTADSVGKLTFSANRSDRSAPLSDILLMGEDLPVDPDAVDFGVDLHVTIVQPVNAEDDAFPIAPNVILEDGGAVVLSVLANDFLQTGSTGTLALASTLPTPPANGTATVVGSQIRYTPAQDFFGTDTFVYRAVDGLGNTDTATVTVTVTSVNDAPVATAETVTVVEDSLANVISVLTNDNGGPANEDQALTITALTQPAHGTVTLINGDTQVEYTPVGNYFGADSFTYRAKDSDDATSNLVTVTINVTNVNDAPTVQNDQATFQEDSTNNVINVLVNDKPGPVGVGDESSVDALTITGVTGFDQGGSASIVGNTIRYTPAANFFGTETFTYSVRDNGGLTATATVTVTVNNVNDPPTANDDEEFVDELTEGNPLNVLQNDKPGPDNEIPIDNLVITAVGTPDSGGTVTIAPDGKSLLYTPETDKLGFYTETFTYTMSDGQFSDTATVTVNVEPVIRPRARDDRYTISEDSIDNVLAVTLFDLFNEGATPSLTQIITPPAHGTAVIDGLNIIYTPVANYFGTDTLVYEVDDDFVGEDEQPSVPSTATVTITITNVNDAPTVVDDATTVLEDSLNNVINVLVNDEPGPVGVGDESSVDTLSIVGVQGFNQGGSATISGGTIRYTPAANFFGTETFTYTVRDTGGLQAVGTVTVTVENVNDNPTANPDSATVNEDSANNEIDVLQNDSILPDAGETLTITWAGVPGGGGGLSAQGGTVTISAGKVLYTPKADFFGADSFSYDISDGNGGTARATVSVVVNDVNDDPTANDDMLMALKNFLNQELEVLDNDSIAPDIGEDLIIIGLGPANETTDYKTPHGTASISPDGKKIIYTPDPDFETVGGDYDEFTYTIDDGRPGADEDGRPGRLVATVQVDVVDAVPSDISGVVYLDVNNNGVRDAQEIELAGVEVTLTGTNIRGVPMNLTVKTDVNGVFLFENILPNAEEDTVGYSITSATERFLIDGIDAIVDSTAGEDLNPGAVGNDIFTGIDLGLWGTQRSEQNYMFGERGLQSKYISIAQYLSSTRKGLAAATNMQGEDFWFALLQGWEGVASVDVQLAADMASCQLTIVDVHGHSHTKTIGYQKYYVAGDRATGDYMIYFNGSAADLGFDLLASNGDDGAEGESVDMYDAQYAEGADVVFAEGEWA